MTTEDAQAAEKVALTDAEMVRLSEAVEHTTEAACWNRFCNGSLPWTVARIKAEAVEQERAAWATKVDRLIDLLCDCGDFDGHPGDCAAYSAITILTAADTKALADRDAGLRAEQDAEAAERLAKGLRGEGNG